MFLARIEYLYTVQLIVYLEIHNNKYKLDFSDDSTDNKWNKSNCIAGRAFIYLLTRMTWKRDNNGISYTQFFTHFYMCDRQYFDLIRPNFKFKNTILGKKSIISYCS